MPLAAVASTIWPRRAGGGICAASGDHPPNQRPPIRAAEARRVRRPSLSDRERTQRTAVRATPSSTAAYIRSHLWPRVVHRTRSITTTTAPQHLRTARPMNPARAGDAKPATAASTALAGGATGRPPSVDRLAASARITWSHKAFVNMQQFAGKSPYSIPAYS